MDNVDSMIGALKDGIDKNSTDAPTMSIDPKTSQVSVVGDPNKVESTSGDYSITFSYPASEVSDLDREKMKLNEETGEYEATIKYTNMRVRPLHRTTVAMDVAEILAQADVILRDGSYTSDTITRDTIKVFLLNIDKLANIAKVTLNITDEQLQYIRPDSLVEFFIQMLDNEPNVIKESAAFLPQSFIKQIAEEMAKKQTKDSPSTQQS